jgi:1,4-alpha-glucan branching enzyme
MDFVLQLHSHLPWVLNHGDWPHGSDWLSEATLETYLPLIEKMRWLQGDDVWAPLTLGITPILANQLAHPTFPAIFEKWVANKLVNYEAEGKAFAERGETGLSHVCGVHAGVMTKYRDLYRSINGDILGEFRRLADEGRIEITGSAATHGFLPLLGRDESIRFQLQLGRREHERLFGRTPVGCWLPECAYRPGGWWEPLQRAQNRGIRHGIEHEVRAAGFQFVTLDAPLVQGRHKERTAYRAYRIKQENGEAHVSALARDQRTAAQIWSADGGYPGDGAYLEFHKTHHNGGLKLWRISGRTVDLGDKQPYWPEVAQSKVEEHARHFATLLNAIAREQHPFGTTLIMAPFDTELFGHWWYEGPEFLNKLYRELQHSQMLRPVTASQHLRDNPNAPSIPVEPGSWGAHADWSTWVGPKVAHTWRRLWPLENAFWEIAGRALGDPLAHTALEQAARTLLLAQSSDWQFIITMAEAADYADHRFHSHCADLEELLAKMQGGFDTGDFSGAHKFATELHTRDDCFPEILPALRAALA